MLVAVMPWSMYLMSNAQILIALNWFVEGDLLNKFKKVYKRPSILVFTTIFFVHLAGLLYTGDFDYAFNDLRIKIPLLSLPIIIGTSDTLTRKEFHLILKFFVASIIASGFFSLAIYLGLTPYQYTDYRSLSVFISHIRFSLLILLSIVVSIYFVLNSGGVIQKTIWVASTILLLYFLMLLHTFTGIFILFVLLLVFIPFVIIKRVKKIYIKISSLLILLSMITFVTIKIYESYKDFYVRDNTPDMRQIDKFTVNGNKYDNLKLRTYENGHICELYICKKELKANWNKISKINYDSTDEKGNKIKYTLIRYLTSKDLRKDSAGLASLSRKDIEAIEKGVPNYLYNNKFSVKPIVYKLLWQIENYKQTNNPNSNSLIQRYEYLKAAKHIISHNYLFGVGTGDVQLSFDNYYEQSNSKLTKKYRLRAHNQFVTFVVAFGVTGFLIILFAIIYPIVYEKNKPQILLTGFLLINFLSWLNEDTIETQHGVTFFVLFYVLFVFAYKKQKE